MISAVLDVDLGLDEPAASQLQQVEIESDSNSSPTPVEDVGDVDVTDSSHQAVSIPAKTKKMFPAQGTRTLLSFYLFISF